MRSGVQQKSSGSLPDPDLHDLTAMDALCYGVHWDQNWKMDQGERIRNVWLNCNLISCFKLPIHTCVKPIFYYFKNVEPKQLMHMPVPMLLTWQDKFWFQSNMHTMMNFSYTTCMRLLRETVQNSHPRLPNSFYSRFSTQLTKIAKISQLTF